MKQLLHQSKISTDQHRSTARVKKQRRKCSLRGAQAEKTQLTEPSGLSSTPCPCVQPLLPRLAPHSLDFNTMQARSSKRFPHACALQQRSLEKAGQPQTSCCWRCNRLRQRQCNGRRGCGRCKRASQSHTGCRHNWMWCRACHRWRCPRVVLHVLHRRDDHCVLQCSARIKTYTDQNNPREKRASSFVSISTLCVSPHPHVLESFHKPKLYLLICRGPQKEDKRRIFTYPWI